MNNGYERTKFEWWYFHFISDISFNIIIHPTEMLVTVKKYCRRCNKGKLK